MLLFCEKNVTSLDLCASLAESELTADGLLVVQNLKYNCLNKWTFAIFVTFLERGSLGIIRRIYQPSGILIRIVDFVQHLTNDHK